MNVSAIATGTFVWGYSVLPGSVTLPYTFLIGPYGNWYRVGINTPFPTLALTLPNNLVTGTAIARDWLTYSDERIKTNIEPISNPMTILKQLRPVRFYQHNSRVENGKLIVEEEGKYRYGFIAQELAKVVPEVTVPPAHDWDLWGVDYSGLVPILTAALQQQQRLLEQQQEEITQLRKQVAALQQTAKQQQEGREEAAALRQLVLQLQHQIEQLQQQLKMVQSQQ